MTHKIFIVLFLMFSTNALAEIAGFPFESEIQEEQFRELALELRCLVCQNQSLADSNAELANDLRQELYQQIISDQSKEQIIDFMTKRYGDFILYKPRFSANTFLLWLSPILLFAITLFFLFRFIKLQRQNTTDVINEEDIQKIRTMIREEEQK